MKTLNIFEVEENPNGEITYYLVNKRGKRVDDAEWGDKPDLQSGVFLATNRKIFTVIGDEVKNFVADKIYGIINFWVYYRIGSQDFIARLEPLGLKFRVKAQTSVTQVGYLSYDGCVIKEDNNWNIYNYSFGTLIIDDRKPDVSLTPDKIENLIKAGFTKEYLITLTDDMRIKSCIARYTTMKLWQQSNRDFCEIVAKFSNLIQEYSAEKIGNTLGLRPYIVTVISQYLEINNFINSIVD